MPLNNAYQHNLNISENSPTKPEKKFRKTSTITLLIVVPYREGLLPAHIMISLKFYWNIAKTRLFQQTSSAVLLPHQTTCSPSQSGLLRGLCVCTFGESFATFGLCHLPPTLLRRLGGLQTRELEKSFNGFVLKLLSKLLYRKKVTSLWDTLAHNHNIHQKAAQEIHVGESRWPFMCHRGTPWVGHIPFFAPLLSHPVQV